MEPLRVFLFASTFVAFFFGLDWLFYSLGILLLCVLFLDLSQNPVPVAKPGQEAAKARQAPIVIQSGQDTTAYDLVTELVSGIVANAPPPKKK